MTSLGADGNRPEIVDIVTERARVARAIADIRILESEIAVFEVLNGRLGAHSNLNS